MNKKKIDIDTPFPVKSAKTKNTGKKIVIQKKKQKEAPDPFKAILKDLIKQQEIQEQERIEDEFFHLQTVWAGQLLLKTYPEIFQSPYLAHMCTAFALGDLGEIQEDDLDRLDHLTQQEFGCSLDEIEVPPRMLAEDGLICQECLAEMEQ